MSVESDGRSIVYARSPRNNDYVRLCGERRKTRGDALEQSVHQTINSQSTNELSNRNILEVDVVSGHAMQSDSQLLCYAD